jgi:hypothetical protein
VKKPRRVVVKVDPVVPDEAYLFEPPIHPIGTEFTDENVAEAFAREMNVDPEDDVVVDDWHWSPAKFVMIHGSRTEWIVVENDDVAEQMAVEIVKQNLKNDPDMFQRGFIESHINIDALRTWVHDAAMEDESINEMARNDPAEFWNEAIRWDIDVPEEDADGNRPDDVEDEYIEALKEVIANDRSANPMSYFEDIYGNEEAAKHAIDAVGIDIDGAAQAAVSDDGWQHYLCHHDGNSYELSNGFVYWQQN